MVAVLVGGLLWVADMGTFDIFGYSFSNLKASFSKTVIKDYEDFPQYVEIKKEKRKKKEKIYLYLFVVLNFLVGYNQLFLICHIFRLCYICFQGKQYYFYQHQLIN